MTYRQIVRLIIVVALIQLGIVLLALTVGGYVTDKRSCVRQAPVRTALHSYALAAAEARERSANHEQLTDPWQASVDRQAAREFRRSAAPVKILDCGTFPLPGD